MPYNHSIALAAAVLIAGCMRAPDPHQTQGPEKARPISDVQDLCSPVFENIATTHTDSLPELVFEHAEVVINSESIMVARFGRPSSRSVHASEAQGGGTDSAISLRFSNLDVLYWKSPHEPPHSSDMQASAPCRFPRGIVVGQSNAAALAAAFGSPKDTLFLRADTLVIAYFAREVPASLEFRFVRDTLRQVRIHYDRD